MKKVQPEKSATSKMCNMKRVKHVKNCNKKKVQHGKSET